MKEGRIMPIRVLIVDDHQLFRQGLISLLNTEEDLVDVVGEANTGIEALQMVRSLKPDLVLMDIYMPDMNGLEAAREIKKTNPNVDIVILTSSEEDKHIKEALEIGISGYLLKNLDRDELFRLLGGIQRGEAAISHSMVKRFLKISATKQDKQERQESGLTKREIDVLKLVTRGYSNHEIAQELCISVNTVKTHLARIMEKLEVDNRTQVAAYAIRSEIFK